MLKKLESDFIRSVRCDMVRWCPATRPEDQKNAYHGFAQRGLVFHGRMTKGADAWERGVGQVAWARPVDMAWVQEAREGQESSLES